MAEPPTDDRPAVPASWLREAVHPRCESCGAKAPTMQTSFNQHIGAVVIMFHREYKGRWCLRCIHQKFWSCTLITLLFGWWGLISFFATPVVLVANVVRYLGSLGLEPPPPRDADRGDAASANLLEEKGDEIVERVWEGQSFGRLVQEVAEPLGAGRAQMAACLLQLVMIGRLTIAEAGSAPALPATTAVAGRPPAGRTVGPGVALVLLGVMNLAWVALFTPVMLTATDTANPPKDAPEDAPYDKAERRPLTPEELATNRIIGLGSAAVNGPAGLLLLVGGVQMVRRRWYPLAVAGSAVAMVPLVTVCCVAGLPVGIWGLVVLLNADVRATFT